jgi:ribosomal protein S4
MYSFKYSKSIGLLRLSRNSYNLNIALNNLPKSSDKLPLKADVPNIGTINIDKNIKGIDHTSFLTKEFKDQFTAHQTLKHYYGSLNKSQLSLPLTSLEERLDTIVYRTGKPKSIFESRFWIKSGKVSLNNKIITSCFSLVKLGDIIHINHPDLPLLNSNPQTHLTLLQPNPNLTIAIYKKPLFLSNIRYPKGFNIDKYLLSRTK